MREQRSNTTEVAIQTSFSIVLLVATLAVPLFTDRAVLVTAGLLVALFGAVLFAGTRPRPARTAGPRRGRSLELLLHLSPVALLTVVFPIASARIGSAAVDGVDLTTLLLASSLTVPWLSQAACLPLYRGIGTLLAEGDREALRARFCAVWPLVLLRSMPVVVIFAVPVQLVMGWPPPAMGAYLLLAVLHLLFAQSLVLTNMGGQRLQWALAWGAYAVALLASPTSWVLPPLAGLLVQLIPLRRHLKQALHPVIADRRDVLSDLVRGLLLGAVLWSDKLLFFLTAGARFAVDTVFLALLPAVLAYNLYFVTLAPSFDRSVRDLRAAMENEPLSRLATHSRALWTTVGNSIARTGLAGAILSFVVASLVAGFTPDAGPLSAAVATASWFFMMTTVVCYKLDYIGQTVPAQVLSGVHLVAVIGAFLLLPAGPVVYLVLTAVGAVVFLAALRSCLRHWRLPEYTLFWRHATSW